MKRGRLIFSMVLCIVYIYLVGWAGGVVGGIAPLATGPHRLFMILGLIFNVVAIGVGYGYRGAWAGVHANCRKWE